MQKTRENTLGCPRGGKKDGEKQENGEETRRKDESKRHIVIHYIEGKDKRERGRGR